MQYLLMENGKVVFKSKNMKEIIFSLAKTDDIKLIKKQEMKDSLINLIQGECIEDVIEMCNKIKYTTFDELDFWLCGVTSGYMLPSYIHLKNDQLFNMTAYFLKEEQSKFSVGYMEE